ncbi:MAG: hypothetical protein RL368_367 [Pseudomonadota bacterium]|jgi:hypothetical protein
MRLVKKESDANKRVSIDESDIAEQLQQEI